MGTTWTHLLPTSPGNERESHLRYFPSFMQAGGAEQPGMEASGPDPAHVGEEALDGFARALTRDVLHSVLHLKDVEEHLLAPTGAHGDGMDVHVWGHRRPLLYRAELLACGSLECPAAPPTTPLLPELQRSRDGFSRKLKGGLAREFQPPCPPPPPTPKEGQNEAEDRRPGWTGVADPRVLLVEELVRSLTAGGAETGGESEDSLSGVEAGEPGVAGGEEGAKTTAYADTLSRDIVDRVTGRRTSVMDPELSGLAERLAGTVVRLSLDEVSK